MSPTQTAARLEHLEKLRDRLSPEQRALLARRLAGMGGAGTSRSRSIPRRRGDGPAPLSFSQRRMWFLEQLDPGSGVYNILAGVRLAGRLNPALLAVALFRVVERHSVLRTTFHTESGSPRQRIGPAQPPALPCIDLTRLPAECREPVAGELARADADRGFDLCRGPLLRTALLRLGDDEHLLLLTLHHIISDGWSMGVLFKELSAFYRAEARGVPHGLPELPIQYADYAAWQQDWLGSEDMARQETWWLEALGGELSDLDFPTDHPRPAIQRARGALCPLDLPTELLARIRAHGREHGVTLFMTLLSAFFVLLYRWSRQEDLLVGTPVAGRNRAETAGLIGFFVNTLVLRVAVKDELTAAEVVERVKSTTLGAFAHQDMPFEHLVDRLQPARDVSRTPLFQVSFALDNTPRDEVSLPGLSATAWRPRDAMGEFDLTLNVEDDDGRLEAMFDYSLDLFEPATAQRLAGHLRNLLDGLSRHPGRAVADLPMLGDAERRQLLAEWQGGEAAPIEELFVHRWVGRRARELPAAIALVDEGAGDGEAFLSYGELHRRCQRLGHRLASLGVGPEVAVAAVLRQGPRVVLAQLATWAAGGIFVPLDPHAPGERLAGQLDEVAPRVVLVEGRTRSHVPLRWTAALCDLDPPEPPAGTAADVAPRTALQPDHAAYVIFTSGSTGRPKGVVVSHRALTPQIARFVETYELTPQDAVFAGAAPIFDVSLEQSLPALVAGARVLVQGDEIWGPRALLERIRRGDLSVLDLPPVMLQEILRWDQDRSWGRLRLVTVGSDAVPPELVKRWGRQRGPGMALINCYGPTEGTITCIFHLVDPAADGTRLQVPIGKPHDGRRAHLLDRRGRPVPPGAPGELWLGGSLARGYLAQPARTAECFVPDPFPGRDGERLYKSGDLARHLTDGTLQFLGRLDHQIKIRGFRIELGEIEAVLARHPKLSQVAVAARADAAGHRHLAVYGVLQPGAEPLQLATLRDFLAEHLPAYMLPSAFVPLEALPVTAAGKVDRERLPLPPPPAAEAFRPPGTALEREIAAVWAEVLGIETVGRDDSFFELGGHSLRMVEVRERLGDLGHQVSMLELFQYPTVRSLAEHLEARGSRASAVAEVERRRTVMDAGKRRLAQRRARRR